MAQRGDGLNDIYDENLTVRKTLITNGFQMPPGAAAAKVLTSDANGTGTWAAAAGGGDIYSAGQVGGQLILGDSRADKGNLVLKSSAEGTTNCKIALNSTDVNTGQLLIHNTDGSIVMETTGNTSDIYLNSKDNLFLYTFESGHIRLDTTTFGDGTGDIDMVANRLMFNGDSMPPCGSIFMFPNNTPPTGFLLCDGSTVSETTYANLFGVIGHSFGGDPGGNFNLPNFTMRFPCGGDVAGGIRPVGTAGGSTSYTPQGTVSSHTTTTANLLGGITAILTGPLAHGFSGTPATIEPPYLAINFIIKY